MANCHHSRGLNEVHDVNQATPFLTPICSRFTFIDKQLVRYNTIRFHKTWLCYDWIFSFSTFLDSQSFQIISIVLSIDNIAI